MAETIFSKIIAGEIPCDRVYEDAHILAFHDIDPKAKVHVLVIPKAEHISGMADVTASDKDLMGHMMVKIPEIAKDLGLTEGGYRVVTNNGDHAGQEVPHIHFHILGGERLGKL